MLFTKRFVSAPKAPAAARGERIYAIGDVHGCHDLLRSLIDQIGKHAQRLDDRVVNHIVLLGDLVDRGPASAEVLDFVYRLQKQHKEVIVLQGNHERMMVGALDGEPGVLRAWLKTGGRETLESFDIDPADLPEEPRAAAARLATKIPAEWINWLRSLPLTAKSGDYFFCHAGVRPGIPLDRQSRHDLLWIREEFLGDQSDHGCMVVHGHSISAEVEIRPNRLGIDTGAYRTGVLSALYLEGDQRDIISTAPGAR